MEKSVHTDEVRIARENPYAVVHVPSDTNGMSTAAKERIILLAVVLGLIISDLLRS